jgi:spermidine synthase
MEQWYREKQTDGTEFNIRIDRHLCSVKSKVQQIDIFDSKDFGRVLVIDGQLMHTEKDEFIYHEMMVHPAMAANPAIEDVLVVGVGDGGIIGELIKYKTVKTIKILENDDILVSVVKRFMPRTAAALSDPRVSIEICDDMKYTRRVTDRFDLIIVDIPDPFGPGENHFTKEYYGNCYTALREDGILINQHESCFYEDDIPACQKAHRNSVKVFDISKVFQASIPTYPSGHWLFGFSSKKFHPTKEVNTDAWRTLGIKTRYYNANLHRGAFALPTYVEDVLKGVE